MKPRKPIPRGKRPRRKTAHQELVEEADAWVKAIVLHRQGPKCLKCNEVKPLHAAHILSKGANPALRYDLENVIGLCMQDHIFWAHRDPVGFTEWIGKIFPGRLDRLREMSRQHCKIDLKELICVLKSVHRLETGDPPGRHYMEIPKDEDLPFA